MNTLTPLEQRAKELREAKYGAKLEWEPSAKQIPTPSLDTVPMTDKWHNQKMAEYKTKFGMTACELVGQAKPAEPTLEDFSIDKARDDMQGKKLKIATASYKDKPVRLYLEITK
jgi:hypothetical protein